MNKLALLVVASLIVILGIMAYPMFSPSNPEMSKSSATAFVLDDLRLLIAQGVEVRVLDAKQTGGKWAVDVLLSRNAHSPCPTVDKRFYTIPPISYRTEPLLSACSPTVSISYREEALINSQKTIAGIPSDAYGCAFLWGSFEQNAAREYCPLLQEEQITAFSENLPRQSWVVQWSYNNATKFVALSSTGQVLKKS